MLEGRDDDTWIIYVAPIYAGIGYSSRVVYFFPALSCFLSYVTVL